MFISATSTLPNISQPTSPSSQACREAMTAGLDFDEHAQDTLEGRGRILHRPHFTPKEYAAVTHLTWSRITMGNNHNVQAANRPSLPPSSDVSGHIFAGRQHMTSSSKAQPLHLARHSTPAILPDRHTPSDKATPPNGLGLDFGLPTPKVEPSDATSTESILLQSRGLFATGEHASDPLDDPALTANPNVLFNVENKCAKTFGTAHSDMPAQNIARSASTQDLLLSALLQRVEIREDTRASDSLAMHCTPKDHMRPDLTCQTLPLPHPDQLTHVHSRAVTATPSDEWISAVPSPASHRSWSQKASLDTPSGSFKTRLANARSVDQEDFPSVANNHTASSGHGISAVVTSTPLRQYCVDAHEQSPPITGSSGEQWLFKHADYRKDWGLSVLVDAAAASAWMPNQQAAAPLAMQTATAKHTSLAQIYPYQPQAVPVDIPFVATQNVYTSLLSSDARGCFSSPPSSSTDSTPSSGHDMFVTSSSSPRGPDTMNGVPSVEVQCKQRKESLYKTELCRGYEEKGHCDYGVKCQFAHGKQELRKIQRHPKWKTELCRTFWRYGTCPYAKRCCFIHEAKEANGASGLAQADTLAMRAPLFARVRANNSSSSVIQSSNVEGSMPLQCAQEPFQPMAGVLDAAHSRGEAASTRQSRTRAAFDYDPFLDSVKAQGLTRAH